MKAIIDLAVNKKKNADSGNTAKGAPEPPKNAATEDKTEALRAEHQRKCLENLQSIQKFVADHAARNHGKLPPALPREFACGNSGYVYFAPFAASPSGKMPLVADNVKANPHPGKINVLFVDGSIETFEFESGSIKRLCSFLHTIYRYDEKEFIRLIERASQLDSGKGN